MKTIKKLIKTIRAFRWGKRLLKEYGERFRYFAVFCYSDKNEIGITFAYDEKYFSVMQLDRIKSYNEFSVRAALSFSASYNDKFGG